jgi:hypothetical protein
MKQKRQKNSNRLQMKRKWKDVQGVKVGEASVPLSAHQTVGKRD